MENQLRNALGLSRWE